MSEVKSSRAHRDDTDESSGPTVEKGLAALDSLYDLRNVIPGLVTTSDLADQEGESLCPDGVSLVADSFSLEHILAAASTRIVETVYQCEPTHPPTLHYLPTASTALYTTLFLSVDLSYFRSRPLPDHGRATQVAQPSTCRDSSTCIRITVQGLPSGCEPIGRQSRGCCWGLYQAAQYHGTNG